MHKKLVIIAEDEPAYQKILETALEKEGCYVMVVHNGDQLMTLLSRSRQPELVVLDLIMPIKSGYEALAEIKKDKHLKNIKVIALSNLGQAEDIAKAKRLGADDYIVKSDETFYNVINKIKRIAYQA